MDLAVDSGTIWLDGAALPGHVRSVRVTGSVRTDNAQVRGLSGTSKQPQGFEDQEVRVEIELPHSEERPAVDLVRELHDRFAQVDSAARPSLFRLTSLHAAARRIDQVIFRRLETRDDGRTDIMLADATFVEYRPVARKLERRVAQAAASEATGSDAPSEWLSIFDPVEGARLTPLSDAIALGAARVKGRMMETARALAGKSEPVPEWPYADSPAVDDEVP